MARRKECTTVYLEKDQIRDLKALAHTRRVPMARLIRDAVQGLLDGARMEIPVPCDDPRQTRLDFNPWPDKDTGGFRQ